MNPNSHPITSRSGAASRVLDSAANHVAAEIARHPTEDLAILEDHIATRNRANLIWGATEIRALQALVRTARAAHSLRLTEL